MKKALLVILALFVLVSIFTGCNKDEIVEQPPVTNEKEEIKIDPDKEEIEAFKNKYVNTDERTIAVMVDNDDENARPQEGMDEAYLIYEVIVEGGATRFMALFKGVDTEKIGPVRSSRHYFLDYALENDAVYTHFGWSPKATTDISALKVNNVNGVTGTDGYIFWREQKFKGDWHSAYTSIKKIKEISEKKGYRLTSEHKNAVKYSDEYFNLGDEKNAVKAYLKYSGGYSTTYKYNEETKLYEKYIGSNPHKMQDGNVLTFKNIIIEFKDDVALGDGTARRNITTTGSGKGYYITNGAYENITWTKNSRTGNTTYKKADGSELVVNPGKTIINVISPSYTVNIEGSEV